jgi:hypothetical protein
MKQVVQVHFERKEGVLFLTIKLMMNQKDYHHMRKYHDVFENFESNDDENLD